MILLLAIKYKYMNLEQKIEAILFFKGEPLSRKRLLEILSTYAKNSGENYTVSEEDFDQALSGLRENLQNRGVTLIEKDGEYMLGTAPASSALIEYLQKEELNKDLSKATLDTLSVILYKNGASRQEIDYIRGVNSSFTLRALSVRGLVEKITDPKDTRRFIYKPSMELLSYLGLNSLADLPEYDAVRQELEKSIQNGTNEQ